MEFENAQKVSKYIKLFNITITTYGSDRSKHKQLKCCIMTILTWPALIWTLSPLKFIFITI